MTLRALELFSGLGGWRYALADRGQVAAAYDISPAANAVYQLNHGDHPIPRELAHVPGEEILQHHADTWLMSPPCQPFCRMGNQLGLEDPRSQAFLRLMDIFLEAPIHILALENVAGFHGSEAHQLLLARFRAKGFTWVEHLICPTRLGIPNQRPRCFILGSRFPLRLQSRPQIPPQTLETYLDPAEDPALYLAPGEIAKHGPGLDIVRPEERRSACFIGGYGQRYVGSGSFLQTPRGIRRFSPQEISRLLGLPTLDFPPELKTEKRYKLLGNSLNIQAAQWLLGALDT